MPHLPVLDSCEGCGACCRTVSVPPFRIDHLVDELTEKQIPASLREEILPWWEVRLQVTGGPCLWFDERTLRCRHYDLRPDACRDFELNSPSCSAVRQEYQVLPAGATAADPRSTAISSPREDRP